jgi:uncharacterized membrane protein YuzA (DUF378 family)
VFGRKRATLKDRVLRRGSEMAGGAASSVRRLGAGAPGRVDRYAAGALLLGVANWVSMGVFNFDLVKAVAGRKSLSGRTAYGLLSASAAYATLRGAQRAAR